MNTSVSSEYSFINTDENAFRKIRKARWVRESFYPINMPKPDFARCAKPTTRQRRSFLLRLISYDVWSIAGGPFFVKRRDFHKGMNEFNPCKKKQRLFIDAPTSGDTVGMRPTSLQSRVPRLLCYVSTLVGATAPSPAGVARPPFWRGEKELCLYNILKCSCGVKICQYPLGQVIHKYGVNLRDGLIGPEPVIAIFGFAYESWGRCAERALAEGGRDRKVSVRRAFG